LEASKLKNRTVGNTVKLRVNALERVYPGRTSRTPVRALDNVSIDVAEGELLVLLGPSGCGKTTLLRCIAGLDNPTGGTIDLGGVRVNDAGAALSVPAYKRNYGMVFQNYALWPHMTVEENVMFPLRSRHQSRQVARERAREVLSIVQCAEFAGRHPVELSGGQQQRVALARALAASPDVLLLDEPLSNLDALLRREMRAELSRLHRETRFTGIYVTHDHLEAFNLGTRVAVMRAGKVEQLATPAEVYRLPATEHVASFLGIRNRFEVERRDGQWLWKGEALDLGPSAQANGRFRLFLRPEDIQLEPGDRTPPADAVVLGQGVVTDVLFGGDRCEYAADCKEMSIASQSSGPLAHAQRGERVVLWVSRASVLLYDDHGLVASAAEPRSTARETMAGRRA
jgi:iron(III) transport system ATP-binding protein